VIPIKVEFKPAPYHEGSEMKVKLTLTKEETRIKVEAGTDPEFIKRLEQWAHDVREMCDAQNRGLKTTLRGKVRLRNDLLSVDLYRRSRRGHVFDCSIAELEKR
jgi:hypothetical protein